LIIVRILLWRAPNRDEDWVAGEASTSWSGRGDQLKSARGDRNMVIRICSRVWYPEIYNSRPKSYLGRTLFPYSRCVVLARHVRLVYLFDDPIANERTVLLAMQEHLVAKP
jgi:hypothetical protein